MTYMTYTGTILSYTFAIRKSVLSIYCRVTWSNCCLCAYGVSQYALLDRSIADLGFTAILSFLSSSSSSFFFLLFARYPRSSLNETQPNFAKR